MIRWHCIMFARYRWHVDFRRNLFSRYVAVHRTITVIVWIATVSAVERQLGIITALILLAVAWMTTQWNTIALDRQLPFVFRDDSPWNWIKVGRQFVQLWCSNKHLIANFNRRFLSAAFTISICLPLEFICPVFVASRLIKNSLLAA